jgi:hypothetical protein
MINPAHSSKSCQHFTPPKIIEAAKRHIGSHFGLDPCSSEEVNNWSGAATIIFTANGIEQLKQLPQGDLTVWCNPPSTYGGECLHWLKALSQARTNGQIKSFYFLFFNRENLGKPVDGLSEALHVHFANRLKYWSQDKVSGQFKEGQWSIQGQSKTKPKPIITVIKGTTANHKLLVVRDEDGVSLKPSYSLSEVKRMYPNHAYRVWTNSPTHPSSLYYFPPLALSKEELNQEADIFEQVWQSEGNVIIPRIK